MSPTVPAVEASCTSILGALKGKDARAFESFTACVLAAKTQIDGSKCETASEPFREYGISFFIPEPKQLCVTAMGLEPGLKGPDSAAAINMCTAMFESVQKKNSTAYGCMASCVMAAKVKTDLDACQKTCPDFIHVMESSGP